MKSIQFVVDDRGDKALWEDFYNTRITEQRAGEPRESLAEVKSSSHPYDSTLNQL